MVVAGMMFQAKYGIAMLLSTIFFFWGMVEWFSISDGCIVDYNEK